MHPQPETTSGSVSSVHVNATLAPTQLRLLVAEDTEMNRRVIVAMLEPIAPLLTFAFDGVQAVELATGSPFDLILMDMRMPYMGGLEAAWRIREHEASRSARRTPILAVTASAVQHEPHEYQAAGLDGIIHKPIDAGKLLAAINHLACAPSQRI